MPEEPDRGSDGHWLKQKIASMEAKMDELKDDEAGSSPSGQTGIRHGP